jgi:hypothetical protein
MAQNVAEDPQQEQGQPGGEECDQSDQTGHSLNIPALPAVVVTQTG